MDFNYELEQGFSKSGAGSKFGGSNYGVKGPRTHKTNQIDRLKSELQKYDITENRRYELADELIKMNSIEYMNMKYLAAVVMVLEDNFKNNVYNEDNYSEFFDMVFGDSNFLNYYMNKIIDIEKENDIEYIKLVKSILYNYMYKLWINRQNKYKF